MLEINITKENIHNFVVTFYKKVMEDKLIGFHFTNILGTDIESSSWKEHIEILEDFWQSMVLGTNSYVGSPFAPHVKLQGLTKDSFETWLKIFFETLDEVYDNKTSVPFKEAGSIIAQNFMRNLRIP